MLKHFRLLIVAVVVMLSAYQAKATHIMGMNITYEYLGGDSFLFRCDFFRYCGGTAFNNGNCTSAAGIGTSATFQVYCPDQGFSTNVTAIADTITQATPICDSLNDQINSCVVGNCGLLGIQWGLYYAVVHFDELAVNSCSNWMFCFQSGARNTGTNYSSQPSIVAYDRLDMDNFPTNSSVQFNSAKPIPFFCDGQEVKYNWSAFDPDGDSLWWELDTAWNSWNSTSGFNPITYQGGFTAMQPMNGVTINNATGQLDFIAQIPAGFNFANYAIAVTVKEYDAESGVYKGEVHRDVQFIVLDSCDNLAPNDPVGILNFAGDGAQLDSNTIEVCFGQDFEFDLIFYDYDTAGNISTDSVNVSCNIGDILDGAVWTHTGTNPDTVHISWSAIPTDQRYVPFNVTVEDDFCPVTGFNIYSYVIRIVPSTILDPDTAICSLDTITIDANGGDTFYWSVVPNPDGSVGDPILLGQNFGCAQCQDPWVHPSQTTTYRVESNLSETCGNVDSITVYVFDAFPIDLSTNEGGTVNEVTYCSTDGLDTILAVTPGGTFIGSGIVNAVDGVFAPDVVDPGLGRDTLIQVIYILEGICANRDTLDIRVKGLPNAGIFTTGPFCSQMDSVQLQGFESGGFWVDSNNLSNPSATGMFYPSMYSSTAPDTVLVYHTINDSGCVNTDSTYFRIIDSYNSEIDSLPKICQGEEFELLLNDYEGDPFGVWSGDDVAEIPEGSGNFYFNTAGLRAGSYDITYSIPGVCGTTTTRSLIINPLPDARIFGADSVYCDNIIDSVILEPATPGGIWGGSLAELHDGWFIPNRVGEGLYNITYELYDTITTCYNKYNVDVRIARTPVSPKVWGGGPYCQGTDLKNLRADGLLTNTFKWFEVTYNPDTTVKDSILLGAGNPFRYGELYNMPTVIYGTQVSEYGCESRTSKVIIDVLPAPQALFKADTTRGNVPLEVKFANLTTNEGDITGATLTYDWTFGPFGTSTEEHPSWTFTEIGKYAVVMVADNGTCTDSFTVVINLDRLTNFFIPNVFSPNGDNVNDKFEWDIEGIGNFEITVYNRWGTKVFYTDKIDEYWDGAKEPEGTYYYIVKGTEMTLDEDPVEYRGDVTLLRD